MRTPRPEPGRVSANPGLGAQTLRRLAASALHGRLSPASRQACRDPNATSYIRAQAVYPLNPRHSFGQSFGFQALSAGPWKLDKNAVPTRERFPAVSQEIIPMKAPKVWIALGDCDWLKMERKVTGNNEMTRLIASGPDGIDKGSLLFNAEAFLAIRPEHLSGWSRRTEFEVRSNLSNHAIY